jgi:hypothetical protein
MLCLAEEPHERDFESGQEYPCYPEILRRLERKEVIKANRDYHRFRAFVFEDILKLKEERRE